MKSKDIALIAIIAIVAGVIALIFSNYLLAAPKNLKTKVEIVDPISTSFEIPGEKYFNDNSKNPTRIIKIEDSQNQNPFNQTQ